MSAAQRNGYAHFSRIQCTTHALAPAWHPPRFSPSPMRSQRSSQSPASSLEAPIQDHDIPDARSMDHACRDAAMADTGTTAASTIGQGRVRAGMWEAGHRAALLLNQKKVNTEWPGPPPPEHTIVVYPVCCEALLSKARTTVTQRHSMGLEAGSIQFPAPDSSPLSPEVLTAPVSRRVCDSLCGKRRTSMSRFASLSQAQVPGPSSRQGPGWFRTSSRWTTDLPASARWIPSRATPHGPKTTLNHAVADLRSARTERRRHVNAIRIPTSRATETEVGK